MPSSGRWEVSIVRSLAARSDIGEGGLTRGPLLGDLVGLLRGGGEPAEAAHQEQPHGAADLIPPWPGAHCCQDDPLKSPSDRCQGRISHHPLTIFAYISDGLVSQCHHMVAGSVSEYCALRRCLLRYGRPATERWCECRVPHLTPVLHWSVVPGPGPACTTLSRVADMLHTHTSDFHQALTGMWHELKIHVG